MENFGICEKFEFNSSFKDGICLNLPFISNSANEEFRKFIFEYSVNNDLEKVFYFRSQSNIAIGDFLIERNYFGLDLKEGIREFGEEYFSGLENADLIILDGILEQVENPKAFLQKLASKINADIAIFGFSRQSLTSRNYVVNRQEWTFLELENYLNKFYDIKRHIKICDKYQLAICNKKRIVKVNNNLDPIKIESTINNEDVTFVVHGLFEVKNTNKLIDSINKFYPNSPIVISTWYDQAGKLNSLRGDAEVVYSDDPGGLIINAKQVDNNSVNRHIKSSKEGLAKVKTKFCVCIRSDMEFFDSSMVKNYAKYSKLSSPKVFQAPVAVFNIYTKKSYSNFVAIERYRYHVSDFIYFGLSSDVKRLLNTDLMNEFEGLYFNFYPKGSDNRYVKKSVNLLKYVPESFVVVNYLKSLGIDPDYKHRFDQYFSKEAERKNKDFILGNFMILDQKRLGSRWQKKVDKKIPLQYNCYSFYEWRFVNSKGDMAYKLRYYYILIKPFLNIFKARKIIKLFMRLIKFGLLKKV